MKSNESSIWLRVIASDFAQNLHFNQIKYRAIFATTVEKHAMRISQFFLAPLAFHEEKKEKSNF